MNFRQNENNSGLNTPQHRYWNLILSFGGGYIKEHFGKLSCRSLNTLRHIARTRLARFRISHCLISDGTHLGLSAFQVYCFWLVQSKVGSCYAQRHNTKSIWKLSGCECTNDFNWPYRHPCGYPYNKDTSIIQKWGQFTRSRRDQNTAHNL